MPSIKMDFADSNSLNRFPAHGKALNSQAIFLLWLPILRLLHNTSHIRRSYGLEEPSLATYKEIKVFHDTIIRLCVSLRELHMHWTTAETIANNSPDEAGFLFEVDAHNAFARSTELMPLSFEQCIILLRRSADLFTNAARFTLFKHSYSAPREFKSLIKLNANELNNLQPFCNTSILIEAFEEHTGWFAALRSSDKGAFAGIRDALEHKPIITNVSIGKLVDQPWQVGIDLGHANLHPLWQDDIIGQLKYVIRDMCNFWSAVCRSAEMKPLSEQWIAPYGDCIVLTGNDSDIAGFWPTV
jgi:hypothetical protein